jgi:Protein of unknown function (DUF2865)
VLGSPADASAQSFFEFVFGRAQRVPVIAAPPLRLGQPGGGVQPTVGIVPNDRFSEPEPGWSRSRSRNERDAGDDGRSYQTMCVRTCDGYYWPVTYPARSSDFKRDASVCQATCGAETRLYTRAGPGSEVEEMRDSDGRSYGSSETAFAYRRGLKNGCSCKPMPWSDGEQARHESYALAAAERVLRIAQVEAERVAQARANADALTTKVADLVAAPPVDDKLQAVDIVDSAGGSGAPVEGLEDGGPLLAGRPAVMAESPPTLETVDREDRGVKAARMRVKRDVVVDQGLGVVKAKRLPPATGRPAQKVQVASVQVKPSGTGLFAPGPPKYRYPGD